MLLVYLLRTASVIVNKTTIFSELLKWVIVLEQHRYDVAMDCARKP